VIKDNVMNICEIIELAKRCSTVRTTADVVASNGPALLFSAEIASDGGGEADAVLRNGHNTKGEILQDLYCVDEAMDSVVLRVPKFFDKGLFIDVGTNVGSITVVFLPFKD
jgi:hypothetical protein